MVSREKSSRGSDNPRRPTRSGLRNFITSAVGRLRNSPERTFQRLDTQADARPNLRHGNALAGSREKSSRGSDSPRRPTRSGFRSFITNSVGRLRNSPERTFQRLGTQTKSLRNRNTSDPLLYPRLEFLDGCYALLALVRCRRRRRWRIAFR